MKNLSLAQTRNVAGGDDIVGIYNPGPPAPLPTIPDPLLYNGLPTPTHAS
jgi:hypothetical protein